MSNAIIDAEQLIAAVKDAVITEMYHGIDTLKNQGATEVEVMAYQAGMNRALVTMTTTLNRVISATNTNNVIIL